MLHGSEPEDSPPPIVIRGTASREVLRGPQGGYHGAGARFSWRNPGTLHSFLKRLGPWQGLMLMRLENAPRGEESDFQVSHLRGGAFAWKKSVS